MILDVQNICSYSVEISIYTILTLKDMIAPKLGNVRMVGDEVVQEVGELVALA